MEPTPLLKLYERLITGALPIEPSMQRHIVEQLVKTKKFNLLGRLASRTDLSSETDAAIAKRREAVVIAGWASRPGLTTQELLYRLDKDTRVATLLPLTALQGLPEEVYSTLASHGSTKLTAALMDNPSVSASIILNHIDNVVRVLDGTKNWNLHKAIATCSRGDESILREIIFRSGKPSTIVAALSICHEPPVNWVESCMSRIDALMETEISQSLSYYNSGKSLLDALASQKLTDEQLKKLRTLVNMLVKKPEKESMSYYARSYEDTRKMLSSKGRGIVDDIHCLKTSTNMQESLEILNKLLPKKSTAKTGIKFYDEFYRQDVLDALTYNGVLPVTIVNEFVHELNDSATMSRLMLNWAKRGELAAVAQCATDSWVTPDWLVDLPDPLAVLKAVVTHVLDTKENRPVWLLSHPMMLTSPDTALAVLPWEWLSSLSSLFTDVEVIEAQADVIAHTAQALISSRLGDDSRKWEAFTMLANEFEGTLPALLDMVELI